MSRLSLSFSFSSSLRSSNAETPPPSFFLLYSPSHPRSLILHSSPLGLSAWQTKAIPWHDYIPVSPDFSDLPSIVLFLRANDDVAERIAANGQAFGRKVLTKEAGMVAVAGELLEWARVWSVGRGEMDYVGHH